MFLDQVGGWKLADLQNQELESSPLSEQIVFFVEAQRVSRQILDQVRIADPTVLEPIPRTFLVLHLGQ
jgi:hypothetical protein